jgi:UDP-N-acetylglucosamine acyltransferase
MNNIHPSAIVSRKAQLGKNVTISPLAIVNDDVIIGDDSFIGPKTVVYSGARIGNNVRIFQSASISHICQDKKFHGEYSECFVGDNSVIHEFVTLHRGTEASGKTVIGKNVFIMAYSHVAHDCIIGDNVIIANCVQIGGHVEIDEHAFIGGYSQIHQFCKVGKYVMQAGGCKATQDVPPFVMVAGKPQRFSGLNKTGLKRKGFSSMQLELLKKIFNILYFSGLNFSQAKEKLQVEFGEEALAIQVIDFLNRSTRGIVPK